MQFAELFPDVVTTLRRRYAEPHRAYHNWNHILELEEYFLQVEGKIDNKLAYLVALYFHDAIYDPLAKDNEENSASLMIEMMSGEIAQADIDAASKIIIATKSHEPDPKNSDLNFFLDSDIAILGQDRDRYIQYAADIRTEYKHFLDDVYNIGRTSVLKAFMEREKLFHTEYFKRRFEQQACRNLQYEIDLLSQ